MEIENCCRGENLSHTREHVHKNHIINVSDKLHYSKIYQPVNNRGKNYFVKSLQ
jgi:hypothetical protein